MPDGHFITFEGGEGTGKSTQIGRLAERLRAQGRDIVVTREPGGTEGAEAVRALLVTGAPERWSAQAEALLNYAARDDHLRRVIRPALQRGAWVLCDRFLDSTRAYQGAAGGVDGALLQALEQGIVGDTLPDLTFVLDVDAAAGLRRAGGRAGAAGEDRFEGMGLAFHERLRRAFLDIAEAEPQRCVVVDTVRDAATVSDEIWREVVRRLGA